MLCPGCQWPSTGGGPRGNAALFQRGGLYRTAQERRAGRASTSSRPCSIPSTKAHEAEGVRRKGTLMRNTAYEGTRVRMYERNQESHET